MKNIKPHGLSLSFADINSSNEYTNFYVSLDPDRILVDIDNVVDAMDFPKGLTGEVTTQVFAHIGYQLLLEDKEDTRCFLDAGDAGNYFLTIKMLYINTGNK